MYTETHNNATRCVTVSSTCSRQATLTFKLSAPPFYETHIYKFPFIYPKIFTYIKVCEYVLQVTLNSILIYKTNIFIKLLKLNANVVIFFYCLFLWYLGVFFES